MVRQCTEHIQCNVGQKTALPRLPRMRWQPGHRGDNCRGARMRELTLGPWIWKAHNTDPDPQLQIVYFFVCTKTDKEKPLIIMHLEISRGFVISSFKSVRQIQVCWLLALKRTVQESSSSSITLNFPTALNA
jgi:hypothetical protein